MPEIARLKQGGSYKPLLHTLNDVFFVQKYHLCKGKIGVLKAKIWKQAEQNPWYITHKGGLFTTISPKRASSITSHGILPSGR